MKIHNIDFTDQEAQEFASYITKSRIEKRIWPQFHKAIAVEWLYQKHNQKKVGMQSFEMDIIAHRIIYWRIKSVISANGNRFFYAENFVSLFKIIRICTILNAPRWADQEK